MVKKGFEKFNERKIQGHSFFKVRVLYHSSQEHMSKWDTDKGEPLY